jgi:hypothetical protein
MTVLVPAPAPIDPRRQLFTPAEEVALAGFLTGYSGLTRDAYALDLRQYVAWCTEHAVPMFGARRADIECFGRHLEACGRARATIARRLCTIACFYRSAEQEGLIDQSPHPQCMSAGLAWTTSPMRPDWTATRSAPCWSRPASRPPEITPCCPCSR